MWGMTSVSSLGGTTGTAAAGAAGELPVAAPAMAALHTPHRPLLRAAGRSRTAALLRQGRASVEIGGGEFDGKRKLCSACLRVECLF